MRRSESELNGRERKKDWVKKERKKGRGVKCKWSARREIESDDKKEKAMKERKVIEEGKRKRIEIKEQLKRKKKQSE